MDISNKTVQIINGQISDSVKKLNLFSFLGISSVPSSISLTASYKNACNPDNYPSNLNVCTGQTGICTPTGWQIKNTYCAPQSELESCCTDPLAPYPSCSNGVVSCTGCPESTRPSCGDPGCSLIGPKCTSTGWVCAPGYACPSDTVLQSCCSGTDHAVCRQLSNGMVSLLCSGCTGQPPTCTPGCDMCGLVCDADGTWNCRQGAECPSSDIMKTCCTDPSKPLATCPTPITTGALCSTSDPSSITCSNCDSFSKPPNTPCDSGSCEGHGWVCTSTGWICSPGVQCPDPAKVNWSTCCSSSYQRSVPYCDPTTNCIKCACPQGSTGCSGQQTCGIPTTQCNQICCPDGIPCSQGPDGNCICCPQNRVCPTPNGEICCQPGEICSNGQCLIPCGSDPVTGQGVLCSSSQQCIEIDNLTPENIAKLKKEYGNEARIQGNSAFVCLNPSSCSITANESSLPSAVHNYYPCLNFPTHDNGKIGYCTEANGTPTGQCFGKYTSSTACSADSACTWRDVLKYMSSQPDPGVPANQIQKELAVAQDVNVGYFCDNTNGTSAFSRVVAYTSDPANCNWHDCWARASQPGVIDIEYNSANGVCLALQSCSNPTSGLQSYEFSQQSGETAQNSYQVPPTTVSGNSSFNSCTTEQCPEELKAFTDFTCIGTCTDCSPPSRSDLSGQVIKKLWSCGLQNSYKCVLDGEGSFTSEEQCEAKCCPQGMTRGSDHNCYYNNPAITASGNCVAQTQVEGVTTTYETELCDHPSCLENTSNVPQGIYYCKGIKNDDNYCDNSQSPPWRMNDGNWQLCDQVGGCTFLNNWYWSGYPNKNPFYCQVP
jgi:hypothetical protein